MLGRKNYTLLAAYKKLVKAIDTSDPKVKAALEAFEPHLGKDGNPLNDVELISVLKLDIGDRICLSAPDFERLSKAFLGEIESRLL